ncbi:MAG TPA: zinc-binding dehydrogenase [Streptosporangiaceae bacterium]|jgi:NADPH:quinone reductase-like Zn-dependent oxidoreductase|nr:zinc-binding dehydrogenase [Streptosporangiaceae bacterium]
MTETMHGYATDPSAPTGVALKELPVPQPGPHDVLVDVAAFGVNRGELSLIQQRPDGWTPGQDLAGTVAVPSADGTGPPAGSRVVGIADQGGWSERAVVPSHRVAVLPDDVSFAEAAALPVAGLTALRTLRTGGPLLGRRVLVTGASGGVGTFAVQLAVAAGAIVTGQVSGPSRAGVVTALGAAEVITEIGPDAGPFDLVVEAVGGQVLTAAVRRLGVGGTATAFGFASGERSDLAFFDFATGAPNAKLQGFFIYRTGEETFGEDLALLAGMVADGPLDPQIGIPQPWSQLPEALAAFRDRKITGKLVLVRD